MQPPLSESVSASLYDQRSHNSRLRIYAEISGERLRQVAKWGREHQTHKHFNPNAHWYWKGCEQVAKSRCDAKSQETITWEDIAYEEFCESMAERDWTKRRKELIQLAAVIVAELEDGDNKNGSSLLS
jgi:hypothetical protein